MQTMTETKDTKAFTNKLDPDLVNTMRSLNKVYGRTAASLSDEYRIPRTTVRDLLARRTYKELPQGLLSWEGEHPRATDETCTAGCGSVYPEDRTKWCSRSVNHVGKHIWLDPRILDGEQVAWLALEMLAIIDGLGHTMEEPCPTSVGTASEEPEASPMSQALVVIPKELVSAST